MKHIIFDCDSTVGLPGKPMDDALALLYLLGRPEKAKILGITCTFANGTAREVYQSTQCLLQEIGRSDIPLLPGADSGEDPRSEAARFIADTINAHPGEITLVAIGSLTNLYGAWLLDNSIFDKVRQIVLMGGYTAPLLYHGRHLDELNFSVNPKAAACVLNHGRNISILTGNNTLEPSYLPKEEFIQKMCSGSASGRYIAEKCGYRFDDKALRDGDAASYCWDVVATVYLLHPELFEDRPTHCYVTEKGMHSGWLGVTEEAPDTCLLNLPVVKDTAAYREEMYGGWKDFRMGEMKIAVICFTRVPRPGKTKTRLMPYLSGEQCAGLHWAFLQDLSKIYDQVDADLFVAYTDDPDWEELQPVFPNARFFPQEGSGLGEKMNHALNTVLALGYERVVLTGSDLPLMTADHLRSGFAALEGADVAIGPTSDGGYYLVGVKEPSPFLFEKQTYGSGSVFENTAAAARAAGRTIAPALPCDDVDTPEDLEKLLYAISPDSHTARYLRETGEFK